MNSLIEDFFRDNGLYFLTKSGDRVHVLFTGDEECTQTLCGIKIPKDAPASSILSAKTSKKESCKSCKRAWNRLIREYLKHPTVSSKSHRAIW